MASSDRITRRAEEIREATALSWEECCRIAEEERDACADLGLDLERFYALTPAASYRGR